MVRELDALELAWTCPPEWIPWESSEEVEPATGIVGQDRAVEAIALGLSMPGVGYNVFVTGLSGTGRLTTIKRFLEERARGHRPPDDVCFVSNFLRPEEPLALRLAAGAGRRFRKAMEDLVAELAESIPEILEDQAFQKRLESALEELKRQENALTGAFEDEVEKAGFQLVQIQVGPVTRPEIYPVVGGKAIPLEELQERVEAGELAEEAARTLVKRHRELKERLDEVIAGVTEIRRKMQDRVVEVRRSVIRPLLDVAVDRVRASTGDDRVQVYLEPLRDDLEEHLELFIDESDDGDRFLRWRVNLAVDNSMTEGLPVIIETEPTFPNVFGTIERSLAKGSEGFTDFTRIRAGSLLRANGGFLVLNAEDLLLDSRVWPALKRALKYSRVQIQSPENFLLGAAALKPRPVPLAAKVIVIGDRATYDLLYRFDRDFSKVFKILADFDTVLAPGPETAGQVMAVLRKVAVEEELLPLDRTGMAALLETAVRQGRTRRKFSSRFSDLADVYREASWVASQEGAERVTAGHVRAAVEARRRRHSLSEERTLEWITEDVIRIDTEGMRVGQLNGLAVYDLGHHRYGKPSRITARVGLGREGVINIERQARLSGPTHDKGVQILTGFLRGTFALGVPLNMACSITFEQSYGGIDGDSASSTEIYAILSALSGLPLRQDVAVTGSVDQFGRIQAIGGVNEKIEGFFRVCAARGLTGTQGVLIPRDNVGDLQLHPEVVEAVRAGTFHVWAVETVEEGIELLSGVPAGTLEEGRWSEEGVYGRCQRRLEEMARLLREAGKTPSSNGEGEREGGGNGDGGG